VPAFLCPHWGWTQPIADGADSFVAWTWFAGEDNSESLLVQLGFEKANKPVNEGDFSEKTAVWLFIIFGSVLVLLGAIGTVWIAYLNPST